MTVIERIAVWKRQKNEQAASGWKLLRKQLLDGTVDDDGIEAAQQCGFSVDDLPEIEAKLRKRVELRDTIDKKPEAVKELEAVQNEIAERNIAFDKIRDQHVQAMEVLDAQRAGLEQTVAAADRAAIVIKHDPIDPATIAEQAEINVRLRELGSQRKRILPNLNESLEDSAAWRLRREQIKAQRLKEKSGPAHELRSIENAAASYGTEVERWQQTLAPIDNEIAALHEQSRALEQRSLTP